MYYVFWVSSVALLRTTTKKSEPNVRKSQEGITQPIIYIILYLINLINF
jgi:acyl CoA:acetate/3-ketoacid CoA transferase